jgi:N-acyl-D-aspartate/D-glutamate deacylase
VLLIPFNKFNNNKDSYDIIIHHTNICDGSGGKTFKADIAITADTIATIGNLRMASAGKIINSRGMAVSPGFIIMVSQADEALVEGGGSESDVRQGVTLEVMGEGMSMRLMYIPLYLAASLQGSINSSVLAKWVKTLLMLHHLSLTDNLLLKLLFMALMMVK